MDINSNSVSSGISKKKDLKEHTEIGSNRKILFGIIIRDIYFVHITYNKWTGTNTETNNELTNNNFKHTNNN